MVNNLLRIGLLMIVIAGILTGSDVYQKLLSSPDVYQYFIFSGIQLTIFVALMVLYLSYRAKSELRRIGSFIQTRREFNYILLVLAYLFIEAFEDILFLQANLREIHYRAYRIILIDNYSLLIFISLVCLISILIIASLKNIRSKILNYTNLNEIGIWMPVVFFSLVFALSRYTKYGIQNDNIGLGIFVPSNTPLPGIHVFIIIIISITTWGLVYYFRKKLAEGLDHKTLDITITVLLFISTVIIWTSVPISF